MSGQTKIITAVFLGLLLIGKALSAEEQTILAGGSPFRAFAMWREQVAEGEAFGPFVGIKFLPPPVAWTSIDFDDQDWYRSFGPFSGEELHKSFCPSKASINGTLCLRASFQVEDPSTVKDLNLSLKYRGGVIVYLNGTEVVRANLPQGEIKPETPGEIYPIDCYLDGEKKTIPSNGYEIDLRIKAGQTDIPERMAKRNRSLGPVAIPLDKAKLVKGANLLAIEVHGSDFLPPAKEFGKSAAFANCWSHMGLYGLKLSSASAGILPNLDRPQGFQVFNVHPDTLITLNEYASPGEGLRPLRLGGPKNGSYSGVVVMASTQKLEGIKATLSDLTQTGGDGKIAADKGRIRYAGLCSVGHSMRRLGFSSKNYEYSALPAFTLLENEAPALIEPTAFATNPGDRAAMGLPENMIPVAMQPVWLTLFIPAETPAGKYTGTLTLTSLGNPETKVPVNVEVIDWTLSSPQKFRTTVSFYQSPETLSFWYKIPRWSEDHWKMIEDSFRLEGECGNNFLFIPLLERGQSGNEESLVFWIKQADGTFKFDFKNFDRYLELASKYCNLKFISLNVGHGQGWNQVKLENNPDSGKLNAGSRSVTLLDAEGKFSSMLLPNYGTPESKAAFQALTDQIKERLAKKGLEKSMLFGVSQDTGVDKAVLNFFNELQPGVLWHYGAHNRKVRKEDPFGLVEYLYVANEMPVYNKQKSFWYDPKPNNMKVVMSQRIYDCQQLPVTFRTMADRALWCRDDGFGRIGFDYWPGLPEGKCGWASSLFSRFPNSSAEQRSPHACCVALPGKKGPVSSSKLEALREGLQEAEARILIEEALSVKKSLSAPLAEQAHKVLEAQLNFCRTVHDNVIILRAATDQGDDARILALYRLAAEIAKTAGSK